MQWRRLDCEGPPEEAEEEFAPVPPRMRDMIIKTLAVARKLVAYLMAVDKSGKLFEMRASGEEAA